MINKNPAPMLEKRHCYSAERWHLKEGRAESRALAIDGSKARNCSTAQSAAL